MKSFSRFLAAAIASAAVLAAFPSNAADNSLRDLMKKMGAGLADGDAKALVPIFTQTKAKTKPELTDWARFADEGKAAAEKGDLDAAKASCKSCHDAYRNTYKTKYGSKSP